MRILLVNKFLHHVGGAETVFFDEWRLLEAAGQEIIPFGMAHPENINSPYARYWVPPIDYQRPSPAHMRNLIHSGEAARQMARLVEDTRPDIAHLHNIYHQLSPSILPVLSKAGIPVVMTVHDYKLICPNYRLFTQNQPCTRCVAGHPAQALRFRCQKSSRLASAMVALETTLHRRQKVYHLVDRYLAPSQFVQEMLVCGGFPAQKIQVLPHAVGAAPAAEPVSSTLPAGKFVLFAGRLEPEKGLEILLAAATRLPDIPFVLAGSGSLSSQLPMVANVTNLGKLSPGQLETVRRQAALAVMPVIWYEVFGLSALEAMRSGLPVVATDIGALPELVQHEHTGLLVPPDDVDALAAAIHRLWHDEHLAHRLGQAAQQWVRTQFRPDQHLATLLGCYCGLLGSEKKQIPA
jgi:glycosyltransferase involved in cell wall biosynthesis